MTMSCTTRCCRLVPFDECLRLPQLVLLEPLGLIVKAGPDLYMLVSGSLAGGVVFLRGCVDGWKGLVHPK